MFEKNDKPLLTFRTLVDVLLVIAILLGLILGILFIVNENYFSGLILLIGVPLLSLLIWLVIRLFITCLCDIKLIRNKLYDISNDNLEVFLKEDEEDDEQHKAE